MRRQNREDYLRAIYQVYEAEDGAIQSVAVAERLGVSKAAVSRMLKKLTENKLVKTSPYSNITFTNKGLSEARRLTHKHRIIEVFLVDVLKVDRKKMHEEAHDLEHAFSNQTIRKLAGFLGNPEFGPDGKRIPNFK